MSRDFSKVIDNRRKYSLLCLLKNLVKGACRTYFFLKFLKPFKRQPYKIVKHTQTIRLQKPSVFDHFARLALKRLKILYNALSIISKLSQIHAKSSADS